MKNPHKYEYAIDPNNGPHRVVRMVGWKRKVLELGSGPGTITKELSGNECRVTALDIDLTAIEKVKSHCEKVYQCDFNDPDWPATLPAIGTFDVLVAADVLEHLYDPWSCMEKLQQFLAVDGSLVVVAR